MYESEEIKKKKLSWQARLILPRINVSDIWQFFAKLIHHLHMKQILEALILGVFLVLIVFGFPTCLNRKTQLYKFLMYQSIPAVSMSPHHPLSAKPGNFLKTNWEMVCSWDKLMTCFNKYVRVVTHTHVHFLFSLFVILLS